MRASSFLLVALAAVAVLAAMLASLPTPQRHAGRESSPVPPTRPAPAAAPMLPRSVLDRQDRVSSRRRREEARVFDRRPLLGELPIDLAGVSVHLAGLTSDGRRTILLLSGPKELRARLYRQALRTFGDDGSGYVVVQRP